MESELKPMWEGKVCATITGCEADQVWLLWEDFLRIDKWFPAVKTCHQVGGVAGQPGCIRYVTGALPNEGEEVTVWAKEKLLTMDRTERCFKYEVVDGNIGLNSYVGTISVVGVDENQNQNQNQNGCRIEWSYVVKPAEGWWTEESLVSFFDSTLQAVAKRMEEALTNKKVKAVCI